MAVNETETYPTGVYTTCEAAQAKRLETLTETGWRIHAIVGAGGLGAFVLLRREGPKQEA